MGQRYSIRRSDSIILIVVQLCVSEYFRGLPRCQSDYIFTQVINLRSPKIHITARKRQPKSTNSHQLFKVKNEMLAVLPCTRFERTKWNIPGPGVSSLISGTYIDSIVFESWSISPLEGCSELFTAMRAD